MLFFLRNYIHEFKDMDDAAFVTFCSNQSELYKFYFYLNIFVPFFNGRFKERVSVPSIGIEKRHVSNDVYRRLRLK